jgi:hypothetical protein
MIGLAALPGCPFTGPDCISEYRSIQLEGTFEGSLRVFLALDEERDAGSDHVTSRRLAFAVFGDLGGVSAIRLVRGEGGPILATMPIQNARAGVLTDVDAFEPQFLTTSYDELFAVLRTQPVFVVLELPGSSMVVGPLPVKYDNPWVHPYCS